MLSQLIIEAYRGIKNLELKDLGRINIIAGANNTGKTSVLEVIRSLNAPNSLRQWRIVGRRESSSPIFFTTVYDTMKSLFPIDIDADGNKIEYSGVFNDNQFKVELLMHQDATIITENILSEAIGRTYYEKQQADEMDSKEYETDLIELQYIINERKCGEDTLYSIQRGMRMNRDSENVDIVKNVIYISPTQHAQNEMYLSSLLNDPDLYDQFVQIMRQFDPMFLSINAVRDDVSHGQKYVILSKNHKEGLLLNAYGDGMKKAILLLSSVIRAKNGILLLDEFETAIHITAMEHVFKWLIETAISLNVQVFMTSHSLEAITSVLRCNKVLQRDMRMITLVNLNNEIKVRNVDGEKALQLLDVYGLELR